MREISVLGGGCFWCIEAVFLELAGVVTVDSGYAGGDLPDPTYEQVCGKRTGHAEVVRIESDPTVVSYETLLRVFFTIHDPTTPNRQGNDVGPQYRSVIFCQTQEQRTIAERTIAELEASGAFSQAIVTQIEDAAPFYPAENYHRQYFALHGHEPYCSYVIAPKVAKFRKLFAGQIRRA